MPNSHISGDTVPLTMTMLKIRFYIAMRQKNVWFRFCITCAFSPDINIYIYILFYFLFFFFPICSLKLFVSLSVSKYWNLSFEISMKKSHLNVAWNLNMKMATGRHRNRHGDRHWHVHGYGHSHRQGHGLGWCPIGDNNRDMDHVCVRVQVHVWIFFLFTA